LSKIHDFDLVPGRTWCKIPVVPGNTTWPFEVAKWFCDDERLRQRLATGLIASHAYLLGPEHRPDLLATRTRSVTGAEVRER
jgi:hypothetical protein